MIPKQMLHALKQTDTFSLLSNSQIEKHLAAMSLVDIAKISGVAEGLATQYALGNSRLSDLHATGWDIPPEIAMQAGRAYWLSELYKDYEAETTNDRSNIEHLAFLYAMREKLRREFEFVVKDSSKSEADLRRANLSLKSVNDEALALERHLELDPAARAAKSAENETARAMADLIDAAGEYLVREGVIHQTKHGPSGITIWVWKDKSYMPYCTDCHGQEFEAVSPYDEKPYPVIFATQKQIDEYVHAADFVPSNAPALPLFDNVNGT